MHSRCGQLLNKVRLHLIILTILLANCNYFNTDKRRIDKVESYKKFFYENQETFEQLTKEIQDDKILSGKNGLLQKTEDLDELKGKKLRRLEIHTFTTSQTNCEQPRIEFITSWTDYPIGQTYLTKDCSDEKSKKGNYWTDGNFIEVWGLGDGWVLWVDSDFI